VNSLHGAESPPNKSHSILPITFHNILISS